MNGKRIVTSAKWVAYGSDTQACIKATIDVAAVLVPPVVGNGHYNAIKREVDAGTLTIEEAD